MKLNIILAIRYLIKNKYISLINAIGLSVGIGICLQIFTIVSYELSFDRFHKDREKIFRVYSHFVSSETERDYPGIYPRAIQFTQDNVSGIAHASHIHSWTTSVNVTNELEGLKVINGGQLVFADSSYFRVFPHYEWIEGSPDQSLNYPFQVVLTESRARQYFGNSSIRNMIGMEIIYGDSVRFTVSGIVRDVTEVTDFTFTDFLSLVTIPKLGPNAPYSDEDVELLNNESRLFIKLKSNVNPENILKQLSKVRLIDSIDNVSIIPRLQPLKDFHFNNEIPLLAFIPRLPVEESTIYQLISLAFALLLMAVINFINLQTAQAAKRAIEVGVRKILGGSRWSLVQYFLVESFLITALSIIISIFLAIALMDYFSEYLPEGVSFNLSDRKLQTFICICLLTIPLASGIYPAIVQSGFQPIHAIKSQSVWSPNQVKSKEIRKILTIFQFSVSQVMIILALVVAKQIDFLVSKDLGFVDKDVIIIPSIDNMESTKKWLLMHELERINGIEKVSLQSQPPSGANTNKSIQVIFEQSGKYIEHWVNIKYGDKSYLNLYDIELLAGTPFLQNDSAANGYLINEAYMNFLGFKHPIEAIGVLLNDKPIQGVVKNFHTESLHSIIQPIVIAYDNSQFNMLSIKLASNYEFKSLTSKTLNIIEDRWNKISPNDKFDYYYLEDRIGDYYQTERKISKLTYIATGIAIIISCLGLFGLSSFTTQQRSREMGIRKAMGATPKSIVLLFSGDYLRITFISFVIGSCVAFYLSNQWLSEFAFRMELTPVLFITSGMISMIIAMTTISLHTFKAARTSPVKTLRS